MINILVLRMSFNKGLCPVGAISRPDKQYLDTLKLEFIQKFISLDTLGSINKSSSCDFIVFYLAFWIVSFFWGKTDQSEEVAQAMSCKS